MNPPQLKCDQRCSAADSGAVSAGVKQQLLFSLRVLLLTMNELMAKVSEVQSQKLCSVPGAHPAPPPLSSAPNRAEILLLCHTVQSSRLGGRCC